MMDMVPLVTAFCAGCALGAFFSLTLWSSVRKMVDEKTPWHVMFGGYLFRTSVVVAGFFLVMAGSWERLMAALAGFVAAKVVMGRILGREDGRMKGIAWRS